MLLIILASQGDVPTFASIQSEWEGTTLSRAVVRGISLSARLKAVPYPVRAPTDDRFRTWHDAE